MRNFDSKNIVNLKSSKVGESSHNCFKCVGGSSDTISLEGATIMCDEKYKNLINFTLKLN